MIKKYILLAIVACLSSLFMFSQTKQEFSVWGMGGLSTLTYDLDKGERKNGFGGGVGVGYTHFFSEQLGILGGLEVSLYNAKANLDKISTNYSVTDIEGENFDYRSAISNYTEKQNAFYLNVPIMVQYLFGKDNRFYIAGGGKIGIPLTSKYKVEGATYQNSGYYEFEDKELTSPEYMGFGTFTDRKVDESMDLKVSFTVSAEAGLNWQLSAKQTLYTGFYCDYGLNNISKNSKGYFVEYNTEKPVDFGVNSVLNSDYTQKGKGYQFTDKVIPLAVGIKIRLAFGI